MCELVFICSFARKQIFARHIDDNFINKHTPQVKKAQRKFSISPLCSARLEQLIQNQFAAVT